jgi:RNA-directed DNA polymerase
MAGTSSLETVSTKQQRIAALAKQAPSMVLTTLAHHMNIDWMKEAHRRTRKSGALGVDGQTPEEYEGNLEGNLTSLLNRAKSGDYWAPPVRRAHVPKGDGKEMRPIGIPTFEDKVLQRAAAMVLEPIYEQDFYDCSYGFRPGRSALSALESFWKQMMGMGGGWVIEVDVKKFFDTLDHQHLQDLIRQRVGDGVMLRLIGKWLNAGVMDDGTLSYPEAGTPQGGVISPLLANIYLHEVLDKWFEETAKPRLNGRAFMVRYADDFILGFANEGDARRIMDVLPQRLAKYGLTIHPEKTRLVYFRPPLSPDAKEPGTFDFLGFTHYWGKGRKGTWVIKRRTAKDRFKRSLKKLAEWCRKHLHEPVAYQHQQLSKKLAGHYGYYGITGNYEALRRLRRRVEECWHKWLARRSQRGMPWERFKVILKRFALPPPRIANPLTRNANP